ncbi:MAG: YCF48-related protein [Gammaproteobacteria bacterium]
MLHIGLSKNDLFDVLSHSVTQLMRAARLVCLRLSHSCFTRRRRTFRSIATISTIPFLMLCATHGNASSYPNVPHSLLLDVTTRTDPAHATTHVVAVGQRGHIIVSADAGQHFEQAVSNTQNTLTSVCFFNEQILLAVGHNLTIIRSEDGGKQWHTIALDKSDTVPFLDVHPLSERVALAVGAYGYVARTEDAGKTWQVRLSTQEDFHLNAIISLDSNRLILAGESGHVYRSTDQGITWTPIEIPYTGSLFTGLFLSPQQVLLLGLRGNGLIGNPFLDEPSWQYLNLKSQNTWFDVAEDKRGYLWMVGAAGQLQSVEKASLLNTSNTDTLQTIHLARPDRKDLAALDIQNQTIWTVGEAGLHQYSLPNTLINHPLTAQQITAQQITAQQKSALKEIPFSFISSMSH